LRQFATAFIVEAISFVFYLHVLTRQREPENFWHEPCTFLHSVRARDGWLRGARVHRRRWRNHNRSQKRLMAVAIRARTD
jgi:hypothetical protein